MSILVLLNQEVYKINALFGVINQIIRRFKYKQKEDIQKEVIL